MKDRKINLHELLEYATSEDSDDYDRGGQDDYSLDHTIDYLVNATRRRQQFQGRPPFQGPQLDSDTWSKMSPTGKKIWGLLTKEDKEAIIKHCTTRDSKDQSKEPARKINVTDTSETLETVDSDVSDSIARLINMVHEESTGTAERLVNMTKFHNVSEAHPGRHSAYPLCPQETQW